jgi:hypothetical protein
MVHTRTGDFDLDMPKGSGARRGAAPTRTRGPAPEAPPPPPPVSIEQLLATQNELMPVLTENLVHRGVRQPHHQPVMDSYSDFLVTHPVLFTEASDPLEADNWLHITESKFGLLHCTEFQKTLYTAQQLRGSANAWWANFTTTLQDGHQVTWTEFCHAFYGHHIPAGLMARKLQEFLHLQQGSVSVYVYSKRFNHLSQYDSYHSDTDEKKMALFNEGLNHVLCEHLMPFGAAP